MYIQLCLKGKSKQKGIEEKKEKEKKNSTRLNHTPTDMSNPNIIKEKTNFLLMLEKIDPQQFRGDIVVLSAFDKIS